METLDKMLEEVAGTVKVMCPCQRVNVPPEAGCALCEGDGYRTVTVRRDGAAQVSRGVYPPGPWVELLVVL